ncbi:VOC family protein [Janibacter sp. UYMM211]|uniref:VOC family protein n=1 Tax=Janibacter sp. UYMM211 TaxID=3156342 RepID=UPI003398188F
MITAVHTLIYSDDAVATRTFFKDVLGLPHVTDAGSSDDPTVAAGDPAGWLVFDTGPSELGVHPTKGEFAGEAFTAPRHHQISLMVDDITATVAELRERGAVCDGEPRDLGFGIGIEVDVPGTDPVLVYEPRHATAYRRATAVRPTTS